MVELAIAQPIFCLNARRFARTCDDKRPDLSKHSILYQSAQATLRGVRIKSVVVFLMSYFTLFSGMSRRPDVFDEGLILTGAMRVAAGQIPHRDLYTLYGPAQFYVLAGLFKLFGELLLLERLFDVLIKALVVTTVYAIASSYCRAPIAAGVSIVTVLWLFGLPSPGSNVIPVSLLTLLSSALILPVFPGTASAKRVFAAGAVAGASALFRYDTGVALLGIHCFAIIIAILFRLKGLSPRLRGFASTVWPYLLGFALLTLPPAIYFLSVVPLASLAHDIILYPVYYYNRARGLPFPGIQVTSIENLGVYLPIPIVALSLFALVVPHGSGAGSKGPYTPQTRSRKAYWQGFLVTFGLLTSAMYLKGLVRVSPVQMYLSIVPSLLLIAVLFEYRVSFPHIVRSCIVWLVWLSALAASWSTLHEVIQLRAQHLSVLERILSPSSTRLPDTQTRWCRLNNPLTEGFCFLPEDDRIHAIEFISSHTRPDQKLYVGVRNHDKIFENDNLMYFATQRLPATKWSELDPDLESRLDIQTQMVREFERNSPPYIVLDSEFESVHEPNDSTKSSGVTLLDEYIRNSYQFTETFGALSIWKLKHGP
jgi:hypothetical protein